MTDPDLISPIQPRLWALIPCAGSGSRAGAAGPKQYQALAGQPLVSHTLQAFAAVPRLAGTVVVVAPGDVFVPCSFATISVADCGGATRAASVLNGLNWLSRAGAQRDDWVLVHDAARCLITPELINILIDACLDDAVGGLLALPLPDTLKQEAAGRVAATEERSGRWLAQTPQMFRLGTLTGALEQARGSVTDESSAIEQLGLAPKLVMGSAQNFKVTYPEDFALAESVLLGRGMAERAKSVRVLDV